MKKKLKEISRILLSLSQKRLEERLEKTNNYLLEKDFYNNNNNI
jgi:hypothetical protein